MKRVRVIFKNIILICVDESVASLIENVSIMFWNVKHVKVLVNERLFECSNDLKCIPNYLLLIMRCLNDTHHHARTC